MAAMLKYLELPFDKKAQLAEEVKYARNGMYGVFHGRPPTLMDAAELSVQAWEAISPRTMKNCFVKANIGVNYEFNNNRVVCVNAVSVVVDNIVDDTDIESDAWNSVVHSVGETRGEMISLLMSELDLQDE